MAKFYALLLFCFLLTARSFGQSPADSLPPHNDSLPTVRAAPDTSRPAVRRPRVKKDSLQIPLIIRTDSLHFSNVKPYQPSGLYDFRALMASNPFFNFFGTPILVVSHVFERRSYDSLFYAILVMLFFFAIVKLLFGKYLNNLLTLFFRVSMRQQQIREQVLQSPFPSLLLNFLFLCSASMYGSFLIIYYRPGAVDHFWLLFAYIAGSLAAIYLVKFLFLRVAGWIFNIPRAADTYLFVVFLTNKVVGIFLLPIVVMLSFSGPVVTEIAVTLSFILLAVCLLYRIIAAFGTLRTEIKISFIHFFLYLCAFEIAPLLLIYKVLLSYLEKAY